MKLPLLVAIAGCLFIPVLAGEKSNEAMKALVKLGYKDTLKATGATPSKPGSGQQLLFTMKGFADYNGPKKDVWQNTPVWSVTGWDKLPAEMKTTVIDTFLNDPDFKTYSETLAKAAEMDCSLGISKGEEEHKALLKRQREYARFLANRTILLIEAGQVDAAFKETLTGLRLMSKSLNDRRDAFTGQVCLAILALHEPQILSLLSTSNSLEHQKALLKELQSIKTKILTANVVQQAAIKASAYKAESLTAQDRKRMLQSLQMKHMDSILAGKPSAEYLAAKARLESETGAWLDDEVAALINQLVLVHKLTETGRSFSDDSKLLASLPTISMRPKTSWASLVTAERVLSAKCRLLQVMTAGNIQRIRKGSFPDSLESFDKTVLAMVPVDPFTEKPFVYTVKDGTLMVYSIGADQKDDAGKAFTPGNNKGDITYSLTPAKAP